MRFSLAEKLLNIANELDAQGLFQEAEALTEFVKVAQQQSFAPNSPMASPTPYNGPQLPNQNPATPPDANAYQGWYNQGQQYQIPNYNGLGQQLLNMPVSGLAAVTRNPDGTTSGQPQQTFGNFANQQMQQVQQMMHQQQTQGNNPNNTVQNARQLQIQNEMAQAQQRYWQLYQEMQNQQIGDGHPTLYK